MGFQKNNTFVQLFVCLVSRVGSFAAIPIDSRQNKNKKDHVDGKRYEATALRRVSSL